VSPTSLLPGVCMLNMSSFWLFTLLAEQSSSSVMRTMASLALSRRKPLFASLIPGLGNESHASRLQLVLLSTAADAHRLGEAREDILKLQIVGRGVVPNAPSAVGILDYLNPTLTNIEAATRGIRGWFGSVAAALPSATDAVMSLGIVAPQKPLSPNPLPQLPPMAPLPAPILLLTTPICTSGKPP